MPKNHQGGSRNVSSWPPFYPRQGMGLRFNPDAHQFMVCRMVCYLVDTKTESIVGSQLRCKPIGQHAQIDRFRFAQQFSKLACFRIDPTAALPVNGFLQRTVALEKVVILQRWRLVKYGFRGVTHSSSLEATPRPFSRARYSSTRSRLPSPARWTIRSNCSIEATSSSCSLTNH